MLKYLLILLAMIVFAGWVLYAWYKRQGVKGMATSTGQGLGILATVTGAVLMLFGKAVSLFASISADDTDDDESTPLIGSVVHDADYQGVASGYTDKNGDIYL